MIDIVTLKAAAGAPMILLLFDALFRWRERWKARQEFKRDKMNDRARRKFHSFIWTILEDVV